MESHRHLSDAQGGGATYDDYVEDTVDPGNALLFAAIAICVGSLVCLPLLVKLAWRCLPRLRRRRREEREEAADGGHKDDDPSSPGPPLLVGFFDDDLADGTGPASAGAVLLGRFRRRKRGPFAGESAERRALAVSRGVAREVARESLPLGEGRRDGSAVGVVSFDDGCVEMSVMCGALDGALDGALGGGEGGGGEEEGWGYLPPPAVPSLDYDDDSDNDDPTKTKGGKPIAAPGYGSDAQDAPAARSVYRLRWVRLLASVVRYDQEMNRLLRLVIPFTCSAVVDTVAELITVALISRALGTDAMIALVMVDSVVGIGSSFTGGWIEAVTSLASQAYGAENYGLVGRYVQASVALYLLCEIPLSYLWMTRMSGVVMWLGFSEDVADLAHGFVWMQVAINMVGGVGEALFDLLEVVEREAFANIMYCLGAVLEVCVVAVVSTQTNPTLATFGWIMLGNEILFLFIVAVVSTCKGWLVDFRFGFRAFRWNLPMLKQLFKTALPLSLGGILAYAEWEILIVFASFLGPAEAATWAILGFCWDIFESTTGAVGDAGEVRCAYQLGKGRPALAKLSAYKSMYLATLVSFVSTGVFLGVSKHLPMWLTEDPTIQAMLTELFPLIALGNVTMTIGMVCWAVVGSQGRYRLATAIATACSVLVTLPLAFALSVWLRINLKGLTFAVVIGYTFTATILTTVLLISDWERLSKKIQDKMGAEEDSETDSGTESEGGTEQGYSRLDEYQPPSKTKAVLETETNPVRESIVSGGGNNRLNSCTSTDAAPVDADARKAGIGSFVSRWRGTRGGRDAETKDDILSKGNKQNEGVNMDAQVDFTPLAALSWGSTQQIAMTEAGTTVKDNPSIPDTTCEGHSTRLANEESKPDNKSETYTSRDATMASATEKSLVLDGEGKTEQRLEPDNQTHWEGNVLGHPTTVPDSSVKHEGVSGPIETKADNDSRSNSIHGVSVNTEEINSKNQRPSSMMTSLIDDIDGLFKKILSGKEKKQEADGVAHNVDVPDSNIKSDDLPIETELRAVELSLDANSKGVIGSAQVELKPKDNIANANGASADGPNGLEIDNEKFPDAHSSGSNNSCENPTEASNDKIMVQGDQEDGHSGTSTKLSAMVESCNPSGGTPAIKPSVSSNSFESSKASLF